ncbi:hypothetical protein Dcar01_01096 [Deinococcus carri]|uniref:DUF3341 domain-containing protein n=1 Tax=Deinococcus carri TaxID=1211323 RepID=A0ABP9W4U1_9DEIO
MPKQQHKPAHLTTLEFPSPEAAWGFAQQALEMGHRVDLPARVNLFPVGMHLAVWVGALIGGAVLGLLGALAENFMLGLPRLGPIFAAPTGAPTVLFAFLGGSVGALTGGLLTLRLAAMAAEARAGDERATHVETGQPIQPVLVEALGERERLAHLAMEWGGYPLPASSEPRRGEHV